VDPSASLDEVEKRKFLTLPGLERRSLGCPARSQSLYRLRYPDPYIYTRSLHYMSFFHIFSRLWRRLINMNSIVQLHHAKELN
jgi:hypothetical protein